MPIQVICRGCHKRFSVSEKFAGKKGPCPHCKAIIEIPKAEAKVHTPEDFESGGRGVDGKLTTKPIARDQTKVSPLVIVGGIAAALVVVAVAWIGGGRGTFEELWIRGVALLLVSPAIGVLGYTFLREAEDLAPFRGWKLWLRATICSVVYIGLWGVFYYLAQEGLLDDMWQWWVIAPVIAAGGAAALVTLDLDYGSGFLHYCFYVFLTTLLGRIAGLGWVWEIDLAGPLT